MLTRLHIFKKSKCLKDSNRIFMVSVAFALCVVMAVFCTSLKNGILAQNIGNDNVTNNFDIEIVKYFTITFQYYLWDDHENCVRFYEDSSIQVMATKDEKGNYSATYQFPTDFKNDIYLQETDDTYYKFASFWGPNDKNATVDAYGNIESNTRRWERIWNPELEKDNSADGSTNLNEDSQITVKGDMIYEVNYYPIKYNINYILGWEEAEGWQLGDPVTSIHGSNALNPGDYTVIYQEEIKEPTRLGYTFLYWTKDGEIMNSSVINSNAGLDIGQATGNNVEYNGGNTFYYIPYLDDEYKGDNGEHHIGKLTPNYDKIMELYNELENNRETGNVTLTAQWELNQYNITYDLNGGSLVSKNGNALPYTYNAETNTFTDESGNTVDYVSGAPTMYDVELSNVVGNVEERKLTIDVKAIPPVDSNSTFAGWQYYDAEGLSQVSTPIVISHGTVGDFNLKAVFINNEATSSNIIYENVPKEWLEGENPLPESYSTSGDATVIPVKSTTREVQIGTDKEGDPIIKKYTFTGWTCSNEYSVAPVRVNGNLTIPTNTQGDIILVAHWQETTEDAYCTVNYYAQKKPHIGFIPEDKVKAGETITLVNNQYTLDTTIYPHAEFDGWYMYTTVGDHIRTYQKDDTVQITGDTAFHAKWITPVTFEPYADETPVTLKLEYDKPISDYESELPTFTKTGYQHVGWNTTVEGATSGKTVNLDEVLVTDGLTLYAVWQEWKYPIKFSDGTNTKEMELDVESVVDANGNTVTMVTLPEFIRTGLSTKDGYLFGGWLYESGQYQPGDKLVVNNGESPTLTAHWIPKTQNVPVKFTASDGTETNGTISIELDDNGQCTFKLSDLQNITSFADKNSFTVYIYNKYGSSYEVGTLNNENPEVTFSIYQSYGEVCFTEIDASLSITCWW